MGVVVVTTVQNHLLKVVQRVKRSVVKQADQIYYFEPEVVVVAIGIH